LIAPHGGRCTDDLLTARGPRPLRTNDLYTAELSIELARRMDASLVANTQADRNQVDLHRISEVMRKAPWFLRLVEALVERILERHAVAEVLFIHGWNVIQAKVDIGIGATLADGLATDDVQDRLTVSRGYLQRRLEALRKLCAGAAIMTSYGERYPAAHPNNFTQLFRRAGGRRQVGASERLVGWARAGRLEAVQLELGVPLRWPGPARDKLVGALATAFERAPVAESEAGDEVFRAHPSGARSPAAETFRGVGVGGTAAAPPPRQWPNTGARPDTVPIALQAHDPLSGIGILTSIGGAPDGSLGGRLLILPGGQSLTIFAGQDPPSGALSVGGLTFAPDGPGFAVRFDGPALRVDDASLYVHMESAQARSELTEVALELRCEPVLGGRDGASAPALLAGWYGEVRGQVRLGGATYNVDTLGFSDAAVARLAGQPATRLCAAFGRALAVVARFPARDGDGAAARLTPAGWLAVCPRGLRVDSTGSAGVLERIVLELAGEAPLTASALSSMVVMRPLADGGHARVTFGFAQFAWGAHRGTGFYEHGELVPAG
jgi:hypothetical protein